jgi:N-acetylglutamate synthase-like GNAT family acetyltransferase
VVNDAAEAYRGVIPADCWKEPYMSREDLRKEADRLVLFWGYFERGRLMAVMGLQSIGDVALIRHAYTRTASQGRGMGTALLTYHQHQADRPLLVGTWTAATWAIRFYQQRGFRLVASQQKEALLRRYWTVSKRQIEESVVLADERWFEVSNKTPDGRRVF